MMNGTGPLFSLSWRIFFSGFVWGWTACVLGAVGVSGFGLASVRSGS